MREIPALSKMENIIAADGHVAPPKRRGKNTFVAGKGLPSAGDPLAQRQLDYNKKNAAKRTAAATQVASFDAHLGTVLNDPTGAIGPNHYVYAFNSGFGILDRNGNVLVPEASLGTLFPGETLGDPVVMYDQFAGRFIIMEFSNSPNGILIAVCKGADPVNDGWHTYRFNTGTFPDYEKMSIWHDGYYITANKDQSSAATSEVVFALERDKMLTGATAQMIGFPLPGISNNGFFSPGGLNALGSTLPPSNVKHQIMYFQDDSWSGVSQDHVKIWETTVDWNNTSNSSITLKQQLNTSAFDAVFNGGSFQNLSEPGGGRKIDAIQATMMFMTNYRRFGTHNSVVFNFVVDVNGNDGLAGIRWYELRQTADGQPWKIYQEGTYTDPNGHNAFCGSIAMDKDGNIGMGYTIVSLNKHLSIRYTGRMAGDALNVMTLPEGVGSDGDARSNRSDGRYGDYAQITLDPTDDLTFWHIGEYMKGSASTVRRSRVVAFRLGTATPDNEAPTTPTNLASSNVGATSVTLSWTASTDNIGVTGYDIYNGGSVIASAAGSATSFNVTGLSPNTAYAFSIRAKDAAGNQSSASNTVNVTTADVSACTGGISSFPYSESFEGNIGAWTQATGDDLNWTVQSGSTPSSNTGPSGAAAGNNYIYVEASDPNYPSKSAIINSPCYDLSGVSQADFNFQYHMFGAADMGTFELQASVDNGISWTTIWSQTGNQGNQWNTVNVSLASYVGNSVQLRFNRVTGGTWQADIAIDDVSVTTGGGGGGGNACTAQVSSFPYSQGFESGIGQWTQDTGDDLNWTVDASGTPSNNTGPGSASEGSNYIFVEASGNGTGYPNKAAIITSPCFDLTSASQASFNFKYHMYGAADMGTIALEASTDNGATWTSIWSQSGNQGNQWNTQTVDLAAYVGGTVKLRFNRVTGGTWQADVALDDINLTTGGSGGGGSNCAPSGNLTLTITFDNYPEETSWQVTNSGGTVVASNSYSTSNPDGSTVNETISGLADGDYTFTMSDSYGDGMCCTYGNGSFTLTDAGGNTIASGGQFTSSDATNFCLGNRSAGSTRIQTQELDKTLNFTVFPNPAQRVLNIDAQGATIDKIQVFSMYGRALEIGNKASQAQMRTTGNGNSFDIANLPAGTYFIRITSGGKTVTKQFIKQ